jgi:hypothetical protein
VPGLIKPLVYLKLPSIIKAILCANVELDGDIVLVKLDPVLTLAGTDKLDDLGIVSSTTVCDAVISLKYLPDTVPLNSILALIVIDFVPSELCGTVTVCVVSNLFVKLVTLCDKETPERLFLLPLTVI